MRALICFSASEEALVKMYKTARKSSDGFVLNPILSNSISFDIISNDVGKEADDEEGCLFNGISHGKKQSDNRIVIC